MSGVEQLSELTRQEQLPVPSMPSSQVPLPLHGDSAPPGHSGIIKQTRFLHSFQTGQIKACCKGMHLRARAT